MIEMASKTSAFSPDHLKKYNRDELIEIARTTTCNKTGLARKKKEEILQLILDSALPLEKSSAVSAIPATSSTTAQDKSQPTEQSSRTKVRRVRSAQAAAIDEITPSATSEMAGEETFANMNQNTSQDEIDDIANEASGIKRARRMGTLPHSNARNKRGLAAQVIFPSDEDMSDAKPQHHPKNSRIKLPSADETETSPSRTLKGSRGLVARVDIADDESDAPLQRPARQQTRYDVERSRVRPLSNRSSGRVNSANDNSDDYSVTRGRVSGRPAYNRYDRAQDYAEERPVARGYGYDNKTTARTNYPDDNFFYIEPDNSDFDDDYTDEYERDYAPSPAFSRSRNVNLDERDYAQASFRDKYNDADEVEEFHETEKYCVCVSGVLDILQEGFGFLRGISYRLGSRDIFVSAELIKRCKLRIGDLITGHVQPPKNNKSFFALSSVDSINGCDAESVTSRPFFDQLTPIFPDESFKLETKPEDMTGRIVDIFVPIGKGQRCLIVSPPKAGKTFCLKQIADGISANHPEAVILALLVDERPEEVTDMERSIKGQVIASTFDEIDPMQHIVISKLVMRRAQRLAEMGKDVVVFIDSLTRLTRAHNNVASNSGRTMSGGLDIDALRSPKQFFGQARNLENGGSLTIIATALIDTGSKMDEVIFEEFKGTGNSEIDLSRKLAERRIFPAIDIQKSGTRHDKKLLTPQSFDTMVRLRQALDNMSGEKDPTEVIMENLKKHPTNEEYIEYIQRKF